MSRLLCVGVWLRAFEASALAQIPETVAPPPRVTIVLVGEASDALALESRVVSWFHEQGTPTVSGRLSTLDPQAVLFTTHEPGVRIWIVLERPASVRLFFAVEGREHELPRYLVRDVALDGGLDELGLEQVAQVVDLSAMALWDGSVESTRQEVERELGVVAPTPQAVPNPAVSGAPPAKTSEASDTRRASWVVGFEYAARWAGPEGIAQGPGSLLGVLWRRDSFELGPRLHAQLLLPREVVHSNVGLSLRGATFGLGASFAQKASEHIWATGELGLGLDLIEYGSVSLADASLRASPSRIESRPLSYASIGVRVHVGVVNIGLAAQLTVQFLRTHYDISDGDQHSELFTPWLVQPGLTANVNW